MIYDWLHLTMNAQEPASGGAASPGAENPTRAKVTIMRKICLILFIGALVSVCGWADDPFQPDKIAECLKNPKASSLEVLTDTNPYYLRGDFDGDGKVDYAMSVRA